MYRIERFTLTSDRVLSELFDQMVKEGHLRAVFYDGQICVAQDFIDYVRSGSIWGYVVWRREDAEPMAVSWVSEISGNVGFVHHWFFKAAFADSVNVALAGMRFVAESTHLTGLVGRTPVSNKLATRFAKRVGYKVLTEISECIQMYDGSVDDGLITFLNLKPFKEEN